MQSRLILWLIFLQGSLSSARRFRRIVNGKIWEGRPRTYHAIRYFGAMADAHSAWFTFGHAFDFLAKKGSYGEYYCGGSLLAPAIFQTACHCLADFDYKQDFDRMISPPVIMNHWEGRKVLYFGSSSRFSGPNSFLDTKYVLSEKFIVHNKCAALYTSQDLTYDYGLIQIDTAFFHTDIGYNWMEIDFAPKYTTEDMLKFHSYALKKELVCLILGFGYYEADEPGTSSLLRHGWMSLETNSSCYRLTYSVSFPVGEWVYERTVPPEYFTWVCTRPFPPYNSYSGSGDSGSPVTCDNRYLSILSFVIRRLNKNTKKRTNVTLASAATVYNLYANAIEYRNSLVFGFYRLGEKYDGLEGRIRETTTESGWAWRSLRRMKDFDVEDTDGVISKGIQREPTMFCLPLVFCCWLWLYS